MAEIDRYLQFMVAQGASDFHLKSGERLTLRVDGVIVQATAESAPPFSQGDVEGLLTEIIPERNLKEFQDRSDTDFAYEISDLGRFRVNLFMHREGMGAVFRHIPQKIMTMEELHLPAVFRELCSLKKGLVLVTGPTGSGKSTTLAAMVDHINAVRRGHIITIEDPIEFVYGSKGCIISQREVHRHTESFKSALRAALREDPDIILVGEMRDLETTEMALETAETGHLVLGTLHTSSAASTVDRIVDQFPAGRQAQIRTMLSTSLKGIICQMLLRRKGGKGRVAAMEILVVTPAVSNNIRDGKTHQIPSAIQTGGAVGMQGMNSHLLKLVEDGVVEPAEAYANSVDRAQMSARLKAAGFEMNV